MMDVLDPTRGVGSVVLARLVELGAAHICKWD